MTIIYNMQRETQNLKTLVLTPIITLIEPQLGENIGMVARAMANMGLSELRLVAPRDGWPNERAIAASSGAEHILNAAQFYGSTAEAIADCHFICATTARQHRQAKDVLEPQLAAQKMRARLTSGHRVAVLFGRERNGLEADEISRAHAILTFPVAEDFSSLNLAQAVLLFGYAWRISEGNEEHLPYVAQLGSPPASVEESETFFQALSLALQQVGYFKPAHREETMRRNLRNIFQRMALTKQDVQTLHGVLGALKSDKRKT